MPSEREGTGGAGIGAAGIGAAEALGHLQAAVLELIAAARVSLEAIEKVVRSVPPPPSEGTGRGPGPGSQAGSDRGVERIRVS